MLRHLSNTPRSTAGAMLMLVALFTIAPSVGAQTGGAFDVTQGLRKARDVFSVAALNARLAGPDSISADLAAQRCARVLDSAVGPQFAFRVGDAQSDPATGYTRLRFDQLYHGLQIVGAECVLNVKAGIVTSMSGRVAATLTIDTIAAQSGPQATLVCMGKAPAGAVLIGAPGRAVIGGRLAYQVRLNLTCPAGWCEQQYYVDADSGSVLCEWSVVEPVEAYEPGQTAPVSGKQLLKESGPPDLSVSFAGWKKDGADHYLVNDAANGYILYERDPATYERTYSSCPSSDWGATNRLAVSVGYSLDVIQRACLSLLGRQSYDGVGTPVECALEAGMLNAFWSCPGILVGTGESGGNGGYAVLDVIAHEFGHGIVKNEVGGCGGGLAIKLGYEEGYCDIFGTMVEFWSQPDGRDAYNTQPLHSRTGQSDWLIGEDILSESSYALRDISHPLALNHASYYRGTNFAGDQYKSSAVMVHAYYVLAEGGSGANDGHPFGPVYGIGWRRAGGIAMQALVNNHSASDGFTDLDDRWATAALQLGESPVKPLEALAEVGVIDRIVDLAGTTTPLPPSIDDPGKQHTSIAAALSAAGSDEMIYVYDATLPGQVTIGASQYVFLMIRGAIGLGNYAIRIADPAGTDQLSQLVVSGAASGKAGTELVLIERDGNRGYRALCNGIAAAFADPDLSQYEKVVAASNVTISLGQPILHSIESTEDASIVVPAGYVPPAGTGAVLVYRATPRASEIRAVYQTIREAMSSLRDGERILVMAGNYQVNYGVSSLAQAALVEFQSGVSIEFGTEAPGGGIWFWGPNGLPALSTSVIRGSPGITLSHNILLFNTKRPGVFVDELGNRASCIGLFGTLCEALRVSRDGTTVQIRDPGEYVEGFCLRYEGLIGLNDPADRSRSTVVRTGFGGNLCGCVNEPDPTQDQTLLQDVVFETNDDDPSSNGWRATGLKSIEFDRCTWSNISSDGVRRLTGMQLGDQFFPRAATSTTTFRDCLFSGYGVAIDVENPPNQSIVLVNIDTDIPDATEGNDLDVEFNADATEFCWIKGNSIESVRLGGSGTTPVSGAALEQLLSVCP